MLYLFSALIVFLASIFLIGKYNKKLDLYRDDEGRIGFIIGAAVYSIFWPITVGLTILGGFAFLIIAGCLKLLKKVEG